MDYVKEACKMRSLFVVLTCLVIVALLIQVTLVGCAKEEPMSMEPPGGEMMPEEAAPEPPPGEMAGEEDAADEEGAPEAADEGEAAGAEEAPVEAPPLEGGE